MPFIKDIRKWVASQRRQRCHRRDSHRRLSTQSTTPNPQRYLSLNYTICLSGPPSYVRPIRPAILEVIQWLKKCWINYPKLRLLIKLPLQILRSIHGQPYGIDQSTTVVADWSIRQFWQQFHKFFGKFITGPYWNVYPMT